MALSRTDHVHLINVHWNLISISKPCSDIICIIHTFTRWMCDVGSLPYMHSGRSRLGYCSLQQQCDCIGMVGRYSLNQDQTFGQSTIVVSTPTGCWYRGTLHKRHIIVVVLGVNGRWWDAGGIQMVKENPPELIG